MPILGYFLSVGGALMALLFVADLYVPMPASRDEAPHAYNIPITAAPTTNAPVVFSGETRDFGRPPQMTVTELAEHPKATAALAQTERADAKPQAGPEAKQDAKPARKKITTRMARRKTAPAENSYAQIPDDWRSRYSYQGTAFARPFGW